jgi:hypothetical protein
VADPSIGFLVRPGATTGYRRKAASTTSGVSNPWKYEGPQVASAEMGKAKVRVELTRERSLEQRGQRGPQPDRD